MTYTIQEVARIFGLTPGAIRFFEEKGLINPGRDEGGRRLFTEQDIRELLYLRKYCAYGLKLGESVEYFHAQNRKSVADINALLAQKEREALRQARYHQEAAKWIAQYNHTLANLDTLVGRLTPTNLPEYYILADDDMIGRGETRQRVAAAWVAALPLTRNLVCTTLQGGVPQVTAKGLAASAENARALELPCPEYTQTLPGGPGCYTVVKKASTGFDGLEGGDYEMILAGLAGQGRVVNGAFVSNILFTHHVGGEQYKYFEVWVPTRPE